MSQCEAIRNEMSAYLDGELAESEQAEVRAHLDCCERCRRHLAELQRLSHGVAHLPRLEPPPGFVAAVREKLSARNEARSWVDIVFRPLWLKLPLEAVAVVTVAVGVMFLAQVQQKRGSHVAGAPAPEAMATTAKPSDVALRTEAATAKGLRAENETRERKGAQGASLQREERLFAAAPEAMPSSGRAPAAAGERGLGRRVGALAPAEAGTQATQKTDSGTQRSAVETVRVWSSDPSQMEQRVRTVLETLGGKVIETKERDQSLRSFRARVPATRVAKFKAQLAELNAESKSAPGLSRLHAEADGMGADAGKFRLQEAERAEAMTELEIQIAAPPAR